MSPHSQQMKNVYRSFLGLLQQDPPARHFARYQCTDRHVRHVGRDGDALILQGVTMPREYLKQVGKVVGQ